jgi:hypothetical protein
MLHRYLISVVVTIVSLEVRRHLEVTLFAIFFLMSRKVAPITLKLATTNFLSIASLEQGLTYCCEVKLWFGHSK